MNRVVNGKGPEVFLSLLWPMENKVKKRCSGPVEDSLNVALNVVLVMRTNTRVAPMLMLILAVCYPFFRSEGMIVRRIVVWFDAIGMEMSF